MKRLLLIMNPAAGTKKANPHMPEILSVFERAGYACTVHVTQKQGDGTQLAMEGAGQADLVVCIGGDGTFNEVISGVVRAGVKTPIGYIPAGSTNDFAASLGLSKHVIQAAQDIVAGKPRAYDVGRFRDRYFTYVASFGAFARTSYATPQSVKNALGHLAYVLQGISDIPSIRPLHMRLELDDLVFEDDYIFGAVSNSTSVGGVLTLDESRVDLNDGLFELVLIKSPKDIFELSECIRALSAQDYSSKMITFVSAPEVRAFSGETLDWTLDGECMPDVNETTIRNLRSAITLYC